MKERPILFSGPMVRAILEGRKTQTRRVLKVQPASVEYHLRGRESDRLRGLPTMRDETGQGWASCGPFRCPFIAEGMYAGEGGRLGNSRIDDSSDRKSLLWVKETFRFASDLDPKSPAAVAQSALEAGYRRPWAPTRYEADGATDNADVLNDFGGAWGKTRVSIHMPRWASRILLKVVSARVERLQEISEDDAKAEGVEALESERVERDLTICHQCGGTRLYTAGGLGGACFDTDCEACDTHKKRYRYLWESINGPGSWDANPWVWVVEFQRVEKEVRA